MGGAVGSGLLRHGDGKYTIAAANPSPGPLEALKALGAETTAHNTEACTDADIVIVAVKPWLVEKVLTEIKPALDYTRQTVVVIAAGISGADMARWLTKGDGDRIPELLIAMPNTAMSVGESMTFIVPVACSGEASAPVVELFNHLGTTMVIDEAHLPAATAIASCGIAYAMRYVRAATEGGVELGFKASATQQMVLQTLCGAVRLLEQDGAHPESEIDKVTTPGGLTIRGLNEMERAGFTSAVIRGLRASIKQS